jgi:hypothetical protein
MGSKYNQTYKKGKFTDNSKWSSYRNNKGLSKSQIADYSKTANVTDNRKLWLSDTRRYDFPGVDTRRDGDRLGAFNYKFRSKKKIGVKSGRENKTYRRYWY